MDAKTAYDQLKYWLPMITGGTLAVRCILWFRSLSERLDSIKNNHLAHIELSMGELPGVVREQTTAIVDEIKLLRTEIQAAKQYDALAKLSEAVSALAAREPGRVR